MINDLFISIINMSFIASFVILGVLLIRLFLKRVPKVFSYVLWVVVLFRLICPFTFESAVGMVTNSSAIIPSVVEEKAQQQTNLDIPESTFVANDSTPTINETTNASIIIMEIGAMIWLLGMVIILIYSVVQLLKLKKKLVGAMPYKENIYLVDHIKSPFVIGMFMPKIYLPSNISENEQDYIIAHEKHHIKRLDHITRILGFVALTLHWFNPLVWVAFVLSGADMEMSCDEAVMKKMEGDIRVEYSQSLLNFATNKKIINATPLAFGEGDTKERVKNVMKYKQPKLWFSIIAIIILICVALVLGTNQIETKTIQDGVYTMVVEDDETVITDSQVYLGQGRFIFKYDPFSSYYNTGEYKIKGDKLILETEDGRFKFIFLIDGDNLIFQEKGSSSVKLIDSKSGVEIVNGSVFSLEDNTVKATVKNTKVEETAETEEAENIKSQEPERLTLEQAVSLALKTQDNYGFTPTECFGEGHIILGYDDSNPDLIEIYALTSVGWYSFENGNFVKESGTGTIPAVVTLDNNNNVALEYPEDGGGYTESIEGMFPQEYHERIFAQSEEDYNTLKLQEEKYAQDYLDKIGREAEIGDYSDFEHVLITDLGVSVKVSNKLLDTFYKEHANYPYFVGTYEKMENGVNMVYEMSYDKSVEEIIFTKYEYNTKNVIEEFIIDAKTGDIRN